MINTRAASTTPAAAPCQEQRELDQEFESQEWMTILQMCSFNRFDTAAVARSRTLFFQAVSRLVRSK